MHVNIVNHSLVQQIYSIISSFQTCFIEEVVKFHDHNAGSLIIVMMWVCWVYVVRIIFNGFSCKHMFALIAPILQSACTVYFHTGTNLIYIVRIICETETAC